MAMSWSDRASSPNNRTSPDSVQATAAEEEAHKHGPFYRNPGKTGDKQSSQPSAPRSNTGSHHVPYRPISDKHFPPKPLSTRRQKKGTAQNTPPANDDKQPRETSLKPEPNIIAILVAAIGIIPPLPRSSAKREREDGSPSIERLRDRGFLVLTDPSQLDTLSRIRTDNLRYLTGSGHFSMLCPLSYTGDYSMLFSCLKNRHDRKGAACEVRRDNQ